MFLGYAIVLVSAHLIVLVGGEPIYFVRLMGGLVMVVGSILLGVMTLYARVLPWWCGVVLILLATKMAPEFRFAPRDRIWNTCSLLSSAVSPSLLPRRSENDPFLRQSEDSKKKGQSFYAPALLNSPNYGFVVVALRREFEV
jgi:hypothetical protein